MDAQQMPKNLETRQIRVASHGQMKSLISNALGFLTEATDDHPRAILLHTRRTPGDKPLASSVELLPTSKLVSIAEILKREYIKYLEAKHLARLNGLYQYNLIGSLSDGPNHDVSDSAEGEGENEDARRQRILNALEGKNFPQQNQTPFMEITLSTIELPPGATSFQSPLIRKLTKSAKRRSKQRAAKARKAEASALP